MKSHLVSLALCLALAVGLSTSSHAQPNGTMGGGQGPTASPATLDDGLESGSIKVSVIAGSAEKPLAAVDVTVNGPGTRVIRTDANGEAIFAGMRSAEYTVSAMADGKPLRSEPFTIPESGGVSVVLSTVAIQEDRGGRPSTRMMSGRARPEQNDRSGMLTVRAVQGELKQSQFGGLVADIPDGALIHLVGVRADGSMELQTKVVKTEDEGRVVFDKLKRDNSVAYYAMTIFEREGGSDRMMTQALQLPPQVGSRMMFAGLVKDSAAKGIDDLVAFASDGEVMPGPGEVSVRIFAESSLASLLANSFSVELIQIGSDAKPLRAPAAAAGPTAATIIGRSGPMEALPGTEPGQVSFFTVRPSTKLALSDIEIMLERVDGGESPPKVDGGESPPIVPSLLQRTDSDGHIFFRELEAGLSYVPVATAYGKEVRGEKFTVLGDKAQTIAFAFEWPEQNVREARFGSVSSGPDKVYIAKVFVEGRVFYSLPFQLTKETGASAAIYMYPKVLFTMHGGAELDDNRLWFQIQLSIANPGVAPLKAPGKGFLIPLPKGFIGASVADEMASRIGVESDKGFIWRGALPPGQRDFIATFALPVEDGRASFDMALPHGLRSGRMVVEDMPGMELRTPAGAKVVKKNQPNGRAFLEMPDMNIAPQQRLVFAIHGLPQPSIWAKRARWAVGAVAILLVLWALFVVLMGRRTFLPEDPVLVVLEADRERLLQQLVKLETEHRHKKIDEKPYKKNRDKLSSKLAAAYRKIDAHKESERSVS